MFASQLAQLPRLSELFVTKGYTQGIWAGPLATQEGSAAFERFLHSLKRLTSLRVLRVAAINDDVSLSRSAPLCSCTLLGLESLGSASLLSSSGVFVCFLQ